MRPLKYALHISQRKTYRLWFWVACSIPPMSVVENEDLCSEETVKDVGQRLFYHIFYTAGITDLHT